MTRILNSAELAALRGIAALKYHSDSDFYRTVKADGIFEMLVMFRELGLVKDEVLSKRGEKLLADVDRDAAALERWKAEARPRPATAGRHGEQA